MIVSQDLIVGQASSDILDLAVLSGTILIGLPEGTNQMTKERVSKDLQNQLETALRSVSLRLGERVPNITVGVTIEDFTNTEDD